MLAATHSLTTSWRGIDDNHATCSACFRIWLTLTTCIRSRRLACRALFRQLQSSCEPAIAGALLTETTLVFRWCWALQTDSPQLLKPVSGAGNHCGYGLGSNQTSAVCWREYDESDHRRDIFRCCTGNMVSIAAPRKHGIDVMDGMLATLARWRRMFIGLIDFLKWSSSPVHA